VKCREAPRFGASRSERSGEDRGRQAAVRSWRESIRRFARRRNAM
jgi:hypothetical protein